MTPTWFAYVMLFSWPIAALCLYRTRPIGQATIWTILGAYMLLPAGFYYKIPMIPGFDKSSISNFAALLGCILVARRRIRFFDQSGIVKLLISVFIFSPLVTSALNNDPIVFETRTLPGLDYYEGLSAALNQFLILIPFFLGQKLLRSSEDTIEIMRSLIIAGLAYSLPMLVEVALSPQLHNWIYGYHPHQFAQQMRGGGFRPVVFMGHGLLVAFFAMTTTVAAAAYWRSGTRVWRLPPFGVLTYLSAMLVMCKTLGAFVYGAALVPLVCLTKPRMQLWTALALTIVALSYPLLRSVELVPTSAMLDVVKSISQDRADSLGTRLANEQELMEYAGQRFLFGWGRFGRNRIHNDYGDDTSITDGAWIITIGQFGLIGFLAEFGLLALPVFRAASLAKNAKLTRDNIFFAALSLIVAVNIFDLLPNAGLIPWTWLLAGALLGRAEALRHAHGSNANAMVRPNAAVGMRTHRTEIAISLMTAAEAKHIANAMADHRPMARDNDRKWLKPLISDLVKSYSLPNPQIPSGQASP